MVSKWLLAVGLFVLGGCSPTNVQKSRYPSTEAARSDGAVARGWVPSWLPAQATKLKEIHSVDTGESSLRFNLPPNLDRPPNPAWIPTTCTPVSYEHHMAARFVSTGWPNAKNLRWFYRVYRCPTDASGRQVYVAKHGSGLHGLFWRVYAR